MCSDCCIIAFAMSFRSVVVGGKDFTVRTFLGVARPIGFSPYIRNGFFTSGLTLNSDGGIHIVWQPHYFFSYTHDAPPPTTASPIKDGNAFLARESTIRKASVNR